MTRALIGVVIATAAVVGGLARAPAPVDSGFELAAAEGMRAEEGAEVVEARTGISGFPRPASEPRSALATTTPRPVPTSSLRPSSDVRTERSSLASWASAEVESSVVPAANPAGIEIPAIDIDAPIVATGLDDSGAMAIPPSPDVVGWYRFGPKPGRDGRAVLAGHVDAAGFGPGAFFDLDRLEVGDPVVIEFDDGTEEAFEVVDSRTVPKAALDVESVFGSSSSPVVHLVTCGGSFNSDTRHYEANVVVTLHPARR